MSFMSELWKDKMIEEVTDNLIHLRMVWTVRCDK